MRPIKAEYQFYPIPTKKGATTFILECNGSSFSVSEATKILIEAISSSSNPKSILSKVNKTASLSLTEEELSLAIEKLPLALFSEFQAEKYSGLILFKFPILTEKWVRGLSKPLSILFHKHALITVFFLLTMVGIAFLSIGFPAVDYNPLTTNESLLIFLSLFVSVLFHELGHSSACMRYGIPPGYIGFGFYIIFPVFFAEVTKAWRLPPLKRVMIDIGGMYFQIILILFASILILMNFQVKYTSLFIVYNLAIVFHNLNPFFKLDGYWILSDLTNTPNLHKKTLQTIFTWKQAGKSRLNKFIILIYSVFFVIYLLYIATSLPFWYSHYIIPSWVESTRQFSEFHTLMLSGKGLQSLELLFKASLRILAVGLPFVVLIVWLKKITLTVISCLKKTGI